MNRVLSYIDGLNLYHGLRSREWKKYYWLDLVGLTQRLLKQQQILEAVHYFTSTILPRDGHDSAMRRQICYLDALRTLPLLNIHLGRFSEKSSQCRHCGAEWRKYEEKMTDVNIATQLLTDAFDDRFETALLISADSDLTTPVRVIRCRFPQKRVIVAWPPERRSEDLRRAATASTSISETALRLSQLPATVTSESGHLLKRPKEWH